MLESICSKHREPCISWPYPVNFRAFDRQVLTGIYTMRLNLVLLVRLNLYGTTLVLHLYGRLSHYLLWNLPLRLVISVSVLVIVSLAASRSFLSLSASLVSAAFSPSNVALLPFSVARSSANFLFCDERASFAEKQIQSLIYSNSNFMI